MEKQLSNPTLVRASKLGPTHTPRHLQLYRKQNGTGSLHHELPILRCLVLPKKMFYQLNVVQNGSPNLEARTNQSSRLFLNKIRKSKHGKTAI
ncbi:hypothetical protein [Chitinophaga caeni]|uniref:hypothetical protein n=1 Tax=Chitinophaga caeni TaxID=2029983 RepID=UPI0012FE3C58|nr:hypothetical protein [Chitinophaga caeni]